MNSKQRQYNMLRMGKLELKIKQAGAELGQAQGKLEVVDELVVEVGS